MSQQRILDLFQGAGATLVQADILQPAEVLLDLYGEDIRGRAYVTHDPLCGELMLRPDFTVPVVQRHMDEQSEPARYCYAGPVFRQQDFDAQRPSEHIQVGFEVFDRGDAAAVEAEVFKLFLNAVDADVPLIVGDVGLLIAAVIGLDTSDARKAALLRHVWRPTRFKALLERFSTTVSAPVVAIGGPPIGLRSDADVADRSAQLAAEASANPIPENQVNALLALLAVEVDFHAVTDAMTPLFADLPTLEAACGKIDARVDAFGEALQDMPVITFRATYGLSAMEYYDGFVFGLLNPADLDGPPLASGGRYDALTRVLGKGREVPAVGGIVRLELLP
ncbi:MAG: ATP phosphoribosyltransferase regulatory subunit [Planktomarina sp.]